VGKYSSSNKYSSPAQTQTESNNAQFVSIDVRSWDDQVLLFETAMENSPSRSIDIAIADAGVAADDDKLCRLDGKCIFSKAFLPHLGSSISSTFLNRHYKPTCEARSLSHEHKPNRRPLDLSSDNALLPRLIGPKETRSKR
jgi:hypothetical protein